MSDTEDDDWELLREYCDSRAEGAFRGLVERHLPAVWSAARRMVNGDGALAEDVAQEVFAHLAVHAPKLPPRVVLAGWLHRHTCFTAAKAVRTAARRRDRELQHAYAMTATAGDFSDPWLEVAPHLDAAINALSAADRDAVVLRFFEKRDFRSIAVMLGTSEDAARMKTARAVEKLRGLLGKRSALVTVALLTGLLADRSVAAPAGGLAGRIAESALARAAGAAVPAAGGVAGMLRRLRPLRAAVIGGALLLLSGFFVWQWTSGMHRAEKPRAAVATGLTNKNEAVPEPAGRLMEVTVRYFLVPEVRAAEILANRWNGDGDTALLESLAGGAGSSGDGVRLAHSRTGRCRSGSGIKLEEGYDHSYASELSIAGKGELDESASTVRKVGSVEEVELTVTDDGTLCDVNMSVEYHYAKPETLRWSSSLADPENKALPGADQPEFRSSKVTEQMLLAPGASGLVQASQLPRLPGTPEQYLFVFLTVSNPEP